MKIDIISVVPGLLEGPFAHSILKRAREKGLLEVNVINLRDHTTYARAQVDDYAFGGGAGMVLMIEPLVNAIEYLQVTTEDNITLDAWINKPKNFDPSKKYPVVLYVYGEPASSTVMDRWGGQNNFLYKGDMRGDGYIQVAIDNRGTPMLKGAAWRKAIYRKVGNVNIRDMALGFKKLQEQFSYFDKDRVAVWGWSGGGSSTLHLLFRYPEIFQTGISIAAVANQLFYDNIYQERYMGLPQENLEDFVNGSPVTYAKNLKGNLLYIHGTGDDNVHFSNAELLVNELIKQGKQFQYMPYPNRSHGISEGAGTFEHLSTLYTNYLKAHCPPGSPFPSCFNLLAMISSIQ